MAQDANLGQQEREETFNGEGVITTPAQTTSPRATEGLSDSLDRLSDDNGLAQEGDQPHDAPADIIPGSARSTSSSTTTEGEDPQSPVPEPIRIPITDSTAEPDVAVGTNSHPIPEQVIEEALPSESLDMHPLEQTTPHAHIDPDHVLLAESGSQDGVAAESMDLSTAAAPSVPNLTQVAAPCENVELGYTDSSVGRHDEPVPSVEVETPAIAAQVEVQMPLHIRAEPKDVLQTPEKEENGVMHGQEQAGPTESTTPCSVSEPSETSIKLKIGSEMWNGASSQLHQVEDDDATAECNTPDAPSLGTKHPVDDIAETTDPSGIRLEGSIDATSSLDAEESHTKPEEQTPQPLLAGLEEAAAGADVTPSATPHLVPTILEQPGGDGGFQWPGTLLEHHLELPPSPFGTGSYVMVGMNEVQSVAKSDDGEEAPETAASGAQDMVSPVSKQDTQIDPAEHNTVVEHATSGPSIPGDIGASEVEQHASPLIPSDIGAPEAEQPHATSGTSTHSDTGALEAEQDSVPTPTTPFKKRKRTAKPKAKRDPALAFSPDEVSGSEYDIPVKKKQKKGSRKKVAARSTGFQAPTVASSSKREPSPVVSPMKQPSRGATSRSTKQDKKGEQPGGKDNEEDAVQGQMASTTF